MTDDASDKVGKRSPKRGVRRLRPHRLSLIDRFRLGGSGLFSRRVRTVLSALGIAIGIAAMVAVVGVSTSSRADLDRRIAALGTNLLTVAPGQDLSGNAVKLPTTAVPMIRRIQPVTSVAGTAALQANLYRNDHIPSGESGGLSVIAADLELQQTMKLTMRDGAWLNQATANFPAVVLGSDTATSLGIDSSKNTPLVWLGNRWFAVVGILNPVPLAKQLDTSAIIGEPIAKTYFSYDGSPSQIYVRTLDNYVESVRSVLGATANPAFRSEVQVSRPSDALYAQQATNVVLTAMLVGLGGVSLLVGGIGIANTMIITVLERRREIGVRRAVGASRKQIRQQFLTEALLLSALGGIGGVLIGQLVTAGYAYSQGWPTVVPLWATVGSLVATVLIGALAGLYPAVRAARQSPIEALATN